MTVVSHGFEDRVSIIVMSDPMSEDLEDLVLIKSIFMKWRPTWGSENDKNEYERKGDRKASVCLRETWRKSKCYDETYVRGGGSARGGTNRQTRMKIIADSLDQKLTLVKSLDKEVIETCNVEEIVKEIRFRRNQFTSDGNVAKDQRRY